MATAADAIPSRSEVKVAGQRYWSEAVALDSAALELWVNQEINVPTGIPTPTRATRANPNNTKGVDRPSGYRVVLPRAPWLRRA
jgi:hypothetical protein